MITELLAARAQMALSLGFHIVFAAIGVAMPALMAIAHARWLRTGDPTYRPGFMVHAGPIIGMPFSWEGAVFFLEAIALGVFLYGWDRVPPWVHWGSGVVVGISGVASAMFVIWPTRG